LDHDRFGLLMWLNLMATSSYLGMYLYSAGAIHFVKMLEKDGVYATFCDQFDRVKSLRDPTKLLKDSFLEGSSSHPLSGVLQEPLLLTHRIQVPRTLRNWPPRGPATCSEGCTKPGSQRTLDLPRLPSGCWFLAQYRSRTWVANPPPTLESRRSLKGKWQGLMAHPAGGWPSPLDPAPVLHPEP